MSLPFAWMLNASEGIVFPVWLIWGCTAEPSSGYRPASTVLRSCFQDLWRCKHCRFQPMLFSESTSQGLPVKNTKPLVRIKMFIVIFKASYLWVNVRKHLDRLPPASDNHFLYDCCQMYYGVGCAGPTLLVVGEYLRSNLICLCLCLCLCYYWTDFQLHHHCGLQLSCSGHW